MEANMRLIAVERERIARARARSALRLRRRWRDRFLMSWQSRRGGEVNRAQRIAVHLRDGGA
jgi:hypothetical protein